MWVIFRLFCFVLKRIEKNNYKIELVLITRSSDNDNAIILFKLTILGECQ